MRVVVDQFGWGFPNEGFAIFITNNTDATESIR